MRPASALSLLPILPALWWLSTGSPGLGRVERVVDGDTLIWQGESARLAGIDAPEKRQLCHDAAGQPWPCGLAAKQALEALVAGGIGCTVTGRDRWQRHLVACVTAEGQDLAGLMVAQGMALAYRRFSGERYAATEASARSRRIGIWGGAFQSPEDWRRGRAVPTRRRRRRRKEEQDEAG